MQVSAYRKSRLGLFAVICGSSWLMCISPLLNYQSEQRVLLVSIKNNLYRRGELRAELARQRKLHVSPPTDVTMRGDSIVPTSGVLERISAVADEVAIEIDSLERDRTQRTTLTEIDEYNFGAKGAFERLCLFISRINEFETGFVITEAVIENPRWPDFDGEVRARLVLSIPAYKSSK